jgi:hypothetical protein
VREAYLGLARSEDKVRVLDGGLTVDEMVSRIIEVVL